MKFRLKKKAALAPTTSNEGFTILELLIATTVFSLVLLGAIAGFIEIGNLFYKGVSNINTQQTANQVLQDISEQFQSNGDFSRSPLTQVLPTSSQSTYAYYCIGNTRYTYIINHELDVAATSVFSPLASGGNFGLLKDTLSGSTGCATPCPPSQPVCPAGSARFNNPVELLGDNMRLSEFEITPSSGGSNFYNVTIVIAYGADNMLLNTNSPTLIGCDPTGNADEFCSVSRLNTSVFKGLGL